MRIKNNKPEIKKIIPVVCLSFFTICCIIAMILVFVLCKK